MTAAFTAGRWLSLVTTGLTGRPALVRVLVGTRPGRCRLRLRRPARPPRPRPSGLGAAAGTLQHAAHNGDGEEHGEPRHDLQPVLSPELHQQPLPSMRLP